MTVNLCDLFESKINSTRYYTDSRQHTLPHSFVKIFLLIKYNGESISFELKNRVVNSPYIQRIAWVTSPIKVKKFENNAKKLKNLLKF